MENDQFKANEIQNKSENKYRTISSLRRTYERLRYGVMSLVSDGFRKDVEMAKYGIGDNILNAKQIQNILTYQRVKGGVSDISLEVKRADILRKRQLQDIDSTMVIVGKMGVLKGQHEILIASDKNGKLHFSNSNELQERKWRKMNLTSLENSVRAIAGHISVPLKWYSEFNDPTLVGVNIKNIENVRKSFSSIEKEFTMMRVYNQHFEKLSNINLQSIPENLYRHVNVDRSYLQGLGLIEGSGSSKDVSLKLVGGDDDMFVLEAPDRQGGKLEDIIVLKNDYESHLKSKNISIVGDLGRGVTLLKVDNTYKYRIGNRTETLSMSEFKDSKFISDQAKEIVLDNFNNKNYHLKEGEIKIKDSIQEVVFRTHAGSGDLHFNVKHGANPKTKDVKLDKVTFDSIYLRLMRPNNIYQFKEVGKKAGFDLPKISINKTKGITR